MKSLYLGIKLRPTQTHLHLGTIRPPMCLPIYHHIQISILLGMIPQIICLHIYQHSTTLGTQISGRVRYTHLYLIHIWLTVTQSPTSIKCLRIQPLHAITTEGDQDCMPVLPRESSFERTFHFSRLSM